MFHFTTLQTNLNNAFLPCYRGLIYGFRSEDSPFLDNRVMKSDLGIETDMCMAD